MPGELLRQELLKLATQRFVHVLLGVVAALETVTGIVSATSRPETSLDVANAAWVFATSAQAGVRGLLYVVMVISAMSVSREFSLGTAKTFLALPIKRRAWIGAKLLALAVLALAMILAIFALAAFIASIHPGWGAIRQEGVVLATPDIVLQSVLIAFGYTALLILPVCAFGLLVGLFFTSSGAAVGTAVLLGLALDAAAGLIDPLSRYVFLAWVPRPLAQVERLAKGMPQDWGDIARWGLTVGALSLIAMAAATLYRFERMDIPS